MFMLDGRPLSPDMPFTISNGTQYPANWLRLASADDKTAIGITEVADPIVYDTRWYNQDGSPKDLAGLKTMMINELKRSAWQLLSVTDWYLARKVETAEEVPQQVATDRAAIRAKCDQTETAINAATDVDALKAIDMALVDRVM